MTRPDRTRPDEAPDTPGEGTSHPRRRVGPRGALVALMAALVAFQGYLLFVQPHGTPASGGRDVRAVGEIAGAVAVRQTLVLRANGFDGITFHVRSTGNEHEGPVILELFEAGADPSGGADRPLYRSTVEARRVVDNETYTWRFSPIDDSSGRRFAVKVSMPAAPFGRGLTLVATRHEQYGDGRFWFDEREQWGDLLFETSATRATSFARLERALRDKPRWLRSRVTLAALFLAHNACLAVIFWTLLTAPLPEGTESDGEPSGRQTQGPWTRRRVGVVAAVVVACAAAAWWWLPRRVPIEAGARLLRDEFPEAEKRTQMPSLQQGFVYQDVWWKGRRLECITALPFSRILWAVDARADRELRGWYGLRQDTWAGPGDGAQFRVGVSDGDAYHEEVKRWLRPFDEAYDRVFVPVRVDLGPYRGRRVSVVFNTEPGPMGNAVGDAAMWCEMRVVERR